VGAGACCCAIAGAIITATATLPAARIGLIIALSISGDGLIFTPTHVRVRCSRTDAT
jgi:hypothetical protein